jgi:hypothetical protein
MPEAAVLPPGKPLARNVPAAELNVCLPPSGVNLRLPRPLVGRKLVLSLSFKSEIRV